MKYSLLILALVLAGCTTPVPLAQKFPDVPEVLKEKCPQLQTITTETTVFSEITKTVTKNYTTYYECAVKLDGWIEWYNTQKSIFDKASKN
jgi:hypothetical protein